MTTMPANEWRPLLYIVSVGAIAAVITGGFFGIGFLLLAPHPTSSLTDFVWAEEALVPLEITPSQSNDKTPGSSLYPPGHTVASVPPSAPPNRDTEAVGSTAMENALLPPTEIPAAKRTGVRRHHHKGARKKSVSVWRPDAQAGPNPGGGFYGPPNINVGHINPVLW